MDDDPSKANRHEWGIFFDEENEYWISKKVGFDVEFELRLPLFNLI